MVFCTSRGKDLELHIRPNGEAVVFCLSGWKIKDIQNEALKKILYYQRRYQIIHCYFLVGIPDITLRVRGDGYEETTMGDMLQCVNKVNGLLLDLTETVKKLNCKVCVCTVAPMDIGKWNEHRLKANKTLSLSHQQEYPVMQKSLENAIITIDKYIIEININNIMVTPFVADTVLTKKGSRNKKHYEKLPDGLHADDDLKEQWGKIIQARIDQNFSMSMGAQCMRDNPSKPRAEDHRSPQRKRGWKTY